MTIETQTITAEALNNVFPANTQDQQKQLNKIDKLEAEIKSELIDSKVQIIAKWNTNK